MIGQTLGQYRIVEQIGKGGMATVFKAYQPGLDRYVAIKVLPAYYAHEEGFSERFVREARAIARLDHPNILPVYDFGQANGLSYIAMKYVAAGTLKDRLGQPLPPEQALGLLKQIAAALEHAHDLGILHRDVKPGNILIDEKGWIYLSDFGLAKMVEGSVQLTGSGVGVGTPAYMSPEQGQGLPVDERTDVYSLGVVLYEMLTGRVPYEAETPMAVVVKHITSPLPLPRVINPAISEAVQRVILKALAKEPDDRFARTSELVNALEAAISQVSPEEVVAPAPVPEVPGPTLRVPSAPTPPTPAAPAPPYRASAPSKKDGLPVLAIAAAGGLVIIVGIVLVVALMLLLGRNRASGDQTDFGGSRLSTAYAVVSPTGPALAMAPEPSSTPVPKALAEVEAPTPTSTPIPTDTPAPIVAANPTEMPSPSSTLVLTDTPTPSSTPVPTDTPTPTATPVPPDTPTLTATRPTDPDTGYRPDPVFDAMWEQLGGGGSPLGYPTGPAVTDRNYAKQYFERGFMYWWQAPTPPEPIWVVVIPDPAADKGTTWMRYDNAWDSDIPLFPPDCPQAKEPLGPMAGFGITWCDRAGVKEQIGAPREREFGSGDVYPRGAVQFFQHGVMFENSADRQIWVLVDGQGWRRASY
jgi:serine/threonine protein kinase